MNLDTRTWTDPDPIVTVDRKGEEVRLRIVVDEARMALHFNPAGARRMARQLGETADRVDPPGHRARHRAVPR